MCQVHGGERWLKQRRKNTNDFRPVANMRLLRQLFSQMNLNSFFFHVPFCDCPTLELVLDPAAGGTIGVEVRSLNGSAFVVC